MEKKPFDWMKVLPHVVAVIVFLTLSLVYFYPVLQGNVLRQSDIQQHKGMSKEIVDHRILQGEEPLWTDSQFGGMPAYQVSTRFDSNMFMYIKKAYSLYLPRPANMLFMYLIGFYILMCCLKINPWLGIVGSIAFALGSYNLVILEVGHNSKAEAISFVAPMLGSVLLLFRSKKILLPMAMLAFFVGLELYSGHPQITYYFAIAMFFIGLGELIKAAMEGRLLEFSKRVGLAVVCVVVGLIANSGSYGLTQEYVSYSTRGPTELTVSPDGNPDTRDKTGGLDRSYITRWSYGTGETLTLLIPNAKGGKSGMPFFEEMVLANNYPETPEGQDAIKVVQEMDEDLRAIMFEEQERGGRVNSYWGNQPSTSGPVYLGAIVCYLFLLSFFVVKDVIRWPILISVLLMIMLGWGKNMMWMTDLFLHLPGYDKFRAVTIILGVVAIFVPILAVMAVNELIKNRDRFKEVKMPFLIVTGAFVLFLLILSALPDTFLNFISNREYEQLAAYVSSGRMNQLQVNRFIDTLSSYRIGLFQADALRSLLFIVLAAGALWFTLTKKIPKGAFIGILALLVILDLYPIDKRFVNNRKFGDSYAAWTRPEEFKLPIEPNQADQAILNAELADPVVKERYDGIKQLYLNRLGEKHGISSLSANDDVNASYAALNLSTHYRVYELYDPFNSANVPYFHKSVGGYHAVKMGRYNELIEWHLGPERSALFTAIQSQDPNQRAAAFLNTPVTNMMNTKYVYMNHPQGMVGPVINPHRNGPAWFVETIQWMPDADSEIAAMRGFDSKRVAIIDQRFEDDVTEMGAPSPSDNIELVSYLPNELVYKTNSASDRFAVFSEIYYKDGWQAYIDDEPVDHVRVNYVLRGMNIPAGSHSVRFKFESSLFEAASAVELIVSLAILLFLLTMIFISIKNKLSGRSEEPPAAPIEAS